MHGFQTKADANFQRPYRHPIETAASQPIGLNTIPTQGHHGDNLESLPFLILMQGYAY